MSKKRVVTDVLWAPAPVAFNEVTLGTYTAICPFCAVDLGVVEARTFGDLYERCFGAMVDHMPTCARRAVDASDLRVVARTVVVKEILRDFVAQDLLEDRREYDVEDLRTSLDLDEETANALYRAVQEMFRATPRRVEN